MIWAKRALAVIAAAGLIVAAVVIRNEVIADDTESTDAQDATTLVCVTELRAICEAVAGELDGVTLRVADAAATTETWATADEAPREVWLTVAPFPDLVTSQRTQLRRPSLEIGVEQLAASALVVAVPNPKAAALTGECGEPLGWRCIGELAGSRWADIEGPAGPAVVKPAFAPLDTAVGQLGVAQAIGGYFGAAPVDATDPGLITWARRLAGAVNAGALSGGTPIGTVQVRDSAVDVAVGFDAEITNAGRDRLTVLYADPMTRVDLVLAAPGRVGIPTALSEALTTAANTAGWKHAAEVPGESLTAERVAAATQLWSDYS